MMIFIFFGLVIAAVIAESVSLRSKENAVRIEYDADMTLAAPDEELTLRYSVTNEGRLPLLFLNLTVSFTEGVDIREDEDFFKKHVRKTGSQFSVNHHLFLMPRGRYSGRIRFSFRERGVHRIGTFYLEAGDFLGLRSSINTLETGQKIIVTARLSEEEPVVETLGGVLGDISVRRFIFEDPNLLIGYREYTGREPLRDISWLQTAKQGQLMVRQNDYTVDNTVAVVVNQAGSGRRVTEECLRLTRTVCETLEERKVPYALLSNGDLGDLPEGLGKSHLTVILKKIGVSRGISFLSFAELIDRCIAERLNNRSYIVITPESGETESLLDHLQSHSDHRLCVVTAGKAAMP